MSQTRDEQSINEQMQTEDDLGELLQIRREKLFKLQQEGNNPYEITKYHPTHYSQYILENFDEMEGEEVTLAGRIMSKRIMGKASFVHILDAKGQIQSYVQINELGKEAYETFKTYDIGDIIGISGEVFRTKREKSQLKRRRLHFYQNLFSLCLKSGMA